MRLLLIVIALAFAPAPPPTNSPGGICDQALRDAQNDYVHGRYAETIARARPCVVKQPGVAWRLIGGAACFLQDRAAALEAFENLDAQGRSFVKYVCARHGLKLP